jgi:tryptophan synthase alpha chain
MTVKLLLQQVKEIRKEVNIPIILMGYLNPVLQYGVEKFVQEAAVNGVDGLILPDMPMDVYQSEYRKMFEKAGLTNTFLISPTTSEDRIKKIDAITSGFIYAVSASATTGAKGGFANEQIEYFKRLKSYGLKNPFLIGFGISNKETFSTASSYSTGAIVGSAFINLLKDSKNIPQDVGSFIKGIKG